MDPFFAVSTWLEIRGDTDGYLFCQVQWEPGLQRIVHHHPWSNKDFVKFMRSRLIAVGIAPVSAKMFTGHSLKRGCVQLLRTLGMKNEAIMRRIKMAGTNAYLRYTEAFNDSCPTQLPDFRNREAIESHVKGLYAKTDILGNEGMFDFLDAWIAAEVTSFVIS